MNRFALHLVVLLAVLELSAPARAQKLTIAGFRGKPQALVAQVAGTLGPALEQQGATVLPLAEYVKVAIKNGYKETGAFGSAALRKVAPVLKLDGLVVGRVGKERVRVAALGPKGALVLEHVVNHEGQLTAELFAEAAAVIIKALGGTPAETKAAGSELQINVGEVQLALEDPTEDTPKKAPTETPVESAEDKPEVVEEVPPAQDVPSGTTTALPDVAAAVGPSLNFRAGLSPRHDSGAFPGLHVEARVFLAALLDMKWVEDLGLGFGFDISLGLTYGGQGDGGWDALHYAWNVDLLYRLHLFDDVMLKPTLVAHLGFGSTTATIDTSQPGVHDTGYLYPNLVLEAVLAVWEPYLTVHVDAGYLFAVIPTEDLSSTGWGFLVGGGVDAVLLDMITIGIGYRMTQFLAVKGLGNEGPDQSMADVHQTGYVRIGWVLR